MPCLTAANCAGLSPVGQVCLDGGYCGEPPPPSSVCTAVGPQAHGDARQRDILHSHGDRPVREEREQRQKQERQAAVDGQGARKHALLQEERQRAARDQDGDGEAGKRAGAIHGRGGDPCRAAVRREDRSRRCLIAP
jgi:hypothetical protein